MIVSANRTDARPFVGNSALAVAFRLPVRIYYEDTDAGGIVYYANYLRFMERARTEWLRHLGCEIDQLAEGDGIMFAVRSVNIDYFRPARLNDYLDVTVQLKQSGGASLCLWQEVLRGSGRLCAADVRLACVDTASLTPRRLPDSLVAALNAWNKS